MNNSQRNYPPPNQPPPARPEADRTNFFTTPLSQRGWPRWAVYLVSLLGGIYLLNPGLGIFELIPDNIPFIGNLDEAGAFMMIWYGLIEYFRSRKSKP